MHKLIHYMKTDGSPNPREDCPLYASLQDGKVRRITDDVFWNKKGKPFPVEYVTTPMMEKGEVVGAATVFRDVTEHKQWEGELQAANERLKLLVGESQERNRNISLINEMNEVFQTCQVSMEAYQAIGHFAPRLFPGEDGALYVLNDSRNLLEAVTVWGESPPPESMFAPEECWAIRRGRLYALEDAGSGLPCPHISGALAGGYLCVPLAAQGETLGILHVRLHPAGREHDPGDPLSPLMEAKQRLALTVSGNIALALANLKLRETLRGQAIRDPLTGLFNRRYLEETLNRELHRIQRLGASLGAVMMDLDHFKQYNDTYGHEGGDAMLRAVGALIKTHCRAEDIQCRYGGEEFLLILPGASLEVTLERAEKLREAVKELQIHHLDRYINPTTMSLGVAVFPGHGATGEDLIRAADNALYRAKAQGRDRVVAASARGAETG
jgi:diguanylate cyclase (GGDEF)-like protein